MSVTWSKDLMFRLLWFDMLEFRLRHTTRKPGTRCLLHNLQDRERVAAFFEGAAGDAELVEDAELAKRGGGVIEAGQDPILRHLGQR